VGGFKNYVLGYARNTRPARSPDGAKRNPGGTSVTILDHRYPHYAALRPGYVNCTANPDRLLTIVACLIGNLAEFADT
jgi:hypothetical protein